MVDGVTADDDKVAPVYKLEEICELLRASDASVVKEVADFVLKRLDNKSPVVKQKVPLLLLSLSPCVISGARVLGGWRRGGSIDRSIEYLWIGVLVFSLMMMMISSVATVLVELWMVEGWRTYPGSDLSG